VREEVNVADTRSAENWGGYKRIEDVLERALLRILELLSGGFSENEAFLSFKNDIDAAPHPAVFIIKGLPPPAPLFIQTLFVCRYASIASAPFSRPSPEAL
jgi:hypothetical protein